MPSITPPTELDQLVALIAAQPGGMGIEAIAKLQGNQLTRRTLQRRLAMLAKQGRIQMQGEARAVRYVCLAPVINGILVAYEDGAATLQATGEVYVPTSPEGEEIKAYVRQPRAMRAPVGYRQAFLEQYHPNHTAQHTAHSPQSVPAVLHRRTSGSLCGRNDGCVRTQSRRAAA